MTSQLSQQIAKQFRDAHDGDNWTAVNLKTLLSDVTRDEAVQQIEGFNSIATLVNHTGYYLDIVIPVLRGAPLVGKDSDSFILPDLSDQEKWQALVDKVFADVEVFAALIESFPDEKWWEPFNDGKYGNYYRNITGIIEHLHYHVGQIAFLKKMLRKS